MEVTTRSLLFDDSHAGLIVMKLFVRFKKQEEWIKSLSSLNHWIRIPSSWELEDEIPEALIIDSVPMRRDGGIVLCVW